MKYLKKAVLLVLCCGVVLSSTGCSAEMIEEILTQLLTEGAEEIKDEIGEEGYLIEESLAKVIQEEMEQEELEQEEKEDETDGPGYVYEDGFYYPIIKSVEVSSSVGEENDGMKLADQNESTSWISEDMDTIGATIHVTFEKEFTISDILILNGPGTERMEEYNDYCRIESFGIRYDNGEEGAYSLKADNGYWSESIIPITTKSLDIMVYGVYDAEKFNQIAMTELTFYYAEDSYFVAEGMGDAPVMKGDALVMKDDAFQPDWWAWSTTGYDAQDMDVDGLRAGKWVSEDGDYVLYIDYSSSPDTMDFGLYAQGEVYQGYAWIDYAYNGTSESATAAFDEEKGLSFTPDGKGNISISGPDFQSEVTLKRQKYSVYPEY